MRNIFADLYNFTITFFTDGLAFLSKLFGFGTKSPEADGLKLPQPTLEEIKQELNELRKRQIKGLLEKDINTININDIDGVTRDIFNDENSIKMLCEPNFQTEIIAILEVISKKGKFKDGLSSSRLEAMIRKKYPSGNNLLHIACMKGCTEVIEYLHNHEFYSYPINFSTFIKDKNYDDYTPFHLACINGNVDVVKFMLESVELLVGYNDPIYEQSIKEFSDAIKIVWKPKNTEILDMLLGHFCNNGSRSTNRNPLQLKKDLVLNLIRSKQELPLVKAVLETFLPHEAYTVLKSIKPEDNEANSSAIDILRIAYHVIDNAAVNPKGSDQLNNPGNMAASSQAQSRQGSDEQKSTQYKNK